MILNKKPTIGKLLILLAVLLAAGCGQKSANLQEDAVAPDKTLYENGVEFLRKNQFIKARLSFQTLINTYPDSEYTPSAYLAIANSYYDEGGTDGLLQAESHYKDFIIYFPTHEMADDAQLKVAAVNYKLMNSPDRDATYTRKANTELERFIREYPDSELAPTAREALIQVKENQAMGVQGIGNFYYKRGADPAAESRYKEVLEKFPEFSELDTTLFRLGDTLMRMQRSEEASVYFSQIAREFPFSDYYDDAVNRLELLEKPIPEIDESEAERRRANLIAQQDDGSVLNPLDLIKKIFSGRADLYEVARKQAEERRMLTQSGANGEQASTNGNNKQEGNR
ncbi:MAG TPA: outer membrane protein assembly factor BamD [Acidobacteriota bacterium]|nr:outer membrane protein assembly factor BamD [Acidobacteriota bacterium]